MLVLYETVAGFALFKLVKDGKLDKPEEIWKDFQTPEQANKTYVFLTFDCNVTMVNYLRNWCDSVKLKAFSKFENTTDALSAVTGIIEGKVPNNLKKFLEDELSEKDIKKEKLIVGDPKLGNLLIIWQFECNETR